MKDSLREQETWERQKTALKGKDIPASTQFWIMAGWAWKPCYAATALAKLFKELEDLVTVR